MTITYQVKNGIYINMTNRCPCACTFCLRQNGPGVYGSDSLWLEREPTVEEVCADLDRWNLADYQEVVFCGYGEPTERLDDLLAVAAHIRALSSIPIRINTNGLADLIAGEPVAAKLEGLIDTVSVSLNTPDSEEYLALVRPRFGAQSYDAMLRFTEDCTRYVPNVVMTVVGEPVTSLEAQDKCLAICDRLGVRLRVRPYEG
ncbi:MAG: TIGR04100 family radical SAM protein [Clostridiales bacterium]|nr:TIGR04100 family radical SAM protein [Clostridiales bacterium]